MRVDPEIALTKFRAAAVWAAVRISPRWASAAFRGGRGEMDTGRGSAPPWSQ